VTKLMPVEMDNITMYRLIYIRLVRRAHIAKSILNAASKWSRPAGDKVSLSDCIQRIDMILNQK
jgi:hypothetical protein